MHIIDILGVFALGLLILATVLAAFCLAGNRPAVLRQGRLLIGAGLISLGIYFLAGLSTVTGTGSLVLSLVCGLYAAYEGIKTIRKFW